MSSVDELRAAVKVAELEEQLVAAKAGDGPDDKLRAKLRRARQEYRELRAGRPAEEGEARPAAIKAKSEVKE